MTGARLFKTARHAAVLGVLLAAFAPGAGPAHAQTPSDAALASGFFKTVFGLEYGARHADAERVKRFTGPVHFHLSNRSQRSRTAPALRFLAGLRHKIAHLDAHVVSQEAFANFRVILVDADDYVATVHEELQADAIAMGAHCLVGVTSRDGRILKATAVIVADDARLFRRCLVEEVLQGLGPMNDDPSLADSVFNDRSAHAHFTEFDRAIVNLLYHPAIRPGMTRAEAGRVLPLALKALHR